MVIDAGPLGTGRGGHGHADALSVKVSFRNRPWLVDAGTFVYITPGQERQAFRGTRAHNTLAVDGLDQAQPEGPFAWDVLPTTRVEHWTPGAGFTLFAGWHSGYERLTPPVRHHRFVFHLDGAFWMVRDVADGQGSHLLETSWHFAPDLEVVRQGNAFLASPSPELGPSSSHLLLQPVSDPHWSSELSFEPISPAYGAMESAPVVRCSARIDCPAEHAVMLIPRLNDTGTFFRSEPKPATSQQPGATYRYETGDVSHQMIFGPSSLTAWTSGPWTSDAKFLYCWVREGLVQYLIFCDGSFVQFDGAPLFSHDGNLQWLEWTNRDRHSAVVCSNPSRANSFQSAPLLRGV
jgi:hypothetical protein